VKLETVAKYLKLVEKEEHRSIDDALLNIEVLKCVALHHLLQNNLETPKSPSKKSIFASPAPESTKSTPSSSAKKSKSKKKSTEPMESTPLKSNTLPSSPLSMDQVVICQHGDACVKRTVKKEGPNNGRHFYVCSKPMELACKTFYWEEDLSTLSESVKN
jgi:hypothetical protein